MPGQIPKPVRLYRITHRENFEHILLNGICNRNHPSANAAFVSIGNRSIINVRDVQPVKIPTYGNIGDYVPFYFQPLSIMLYNILTGFNGVEKLPPEQIIFLVSSIDSINKSVNQYFFTDGQANTIISGHYNDLNDLDKVDWDTVMSRDFRKTLEDNDRPRRYQAEFLAYSVVPIAAIEGIIVYNQQCYNFVKLILDRLGLNMQIYISKSYYFNH